MIFKYHGGYEKGIIIYCKKISYQKMFDNGHYRGSGTGSKLCYFKGYLLHRKNGPAIEWGNGCKYWYFNGLRHRENGPSTELLYGYKSWFLNGKEYSEQEYWKIINLKKNGQVLDEV